MNKTAYNMEFDFFRNLSHYIDAIYSADERSIARDDHPC
jgi:hypothetical protein